MKLILGFTSLLVFFQVHAQELFKPIPSQSVIEWLNVGADKAAEGKPNETRGRSEIVIHYYWATWCGPCVISLEQLKVLQKKYGDRLTIFAYSNESHKVIARYLKEKFSDKPPFQYGRIKTKEESSQTELTHWTSSFPYLFIVQNDLLIWHGNPTYPKRDFERFLVNWESGKWTKEAVSKKNKINSQTLGEIKILSGRKSENLRKVLRIERELSLKNKVIFDNTSNYIYFRNFIKAEVNVIKIQKQLMGRKEFQDYEKEQLKKRERDFLSAAEVFKESREELFFVARDLLFAESEFKNLKLAEDFIKRATKLPDDGVTYPDYNLWVQGELYKEKRNWVLAKKYNDMAIEKCQQQTHCSQFIDMYKKTGNEIKNRLAAHCDGFWSCAKGAVSSIF